jgi:hypothetical protein
MQLEELEANIGENIENMKDKHTRILGSVNEYRSRVEKEIETIKHQHDEDLDILDRDVKEEVGHKEEELGILRDAVETEKVKMLKLEKMMKRYE